MGHFSIKIITFFLFIIFYNFLWINVLCFLSIYLGSKDQSRLVDIVICILNSTLD